MAITLNGNWQSGKAYDLHTVASTHLGVDEHGQPRNNIGNWRSVAVEVFGNFRGRDLYTQKDKRMAEIADCGMIIWDGQSSGSVQNMIWMIENNKVSLVFHARKREFIKIKDRSDLSSIMNSIDHASREDINRKIGVDKYIKGNDRALQTSLDL